MALRSATVRPALLAVFLVACGGSNPAQPTPSPADPPTDPSRAAADPSPATSSSPPPSSAVAPSASLSFPTVCADKSAEICTPAPVFVDWLCTKSHQDVAL